MTWARSRVSDKSVMATWISSLSSIPIRPSEVDTVSPIPLTPPSTYRDIRPSEVDTVSPTPHHPALHIPDSSYQTYS